MKKPNEVAMKWHRNIEASKGSVFGIVAIKTTKTKYPIIALPSPTPTYLNVNLFKMTRLQLVMYPKILFIVCENPKGGFAN